MRLLTVILGCLTVATTCPAQIPNWNQTTTSTSPSPRAWHEVAYDTARQRTVLFGGGYVIRMGNTTVIAFLGDTWEWDGVNWAQIKPTNAPAVRWAQAMVFDVSRQRTVMFGGQRNNGFLADTWEWDGQNWTQVNTATSPSPRGAEMAYDSVRRRTVLFGGYSRLGAQSDTWEYDGTNWTQIRTTVSPPARAFHAMAYDIARRRTVLFGGGFSRHPNTWEYDGTNWTQINTTTSPPARYYNSMVYDSVRRRTVLFGGRNPSQSFDDTWEWDGKNWAQIKPISAPSARIGMGLAFDSVRQRTVLFGGRIGSGDSSDTWEYGSFRLTLTANTSTISIANGGTQVFTLDAGTGLRSRLYWILGSATSTMPGIVLTGIHIPLRPDLYTDVVIGTANSREFTKFKGTLGATGTATASLNVPARLPIPSGFKLYHSYIVFDPTTGKVFTSSNPVSVEFK